MNNLYGFRIDNIAGQGFKRCKKDEFATKLNEPIPVEIKRICFATNFMRYKQAFEYCKMAAKKHGLFFMIFTKEEFEKLN